METTSRLGLWTPEEGDSVVALREAIAANAAGLDQAATDDQGSLALRPVSTPANPGKPGRYYFATDNQVLYRDHGTGWTAVSPDTATIEPWPLDAAGDGWLFCDNAPVTAAAAPILRAALLAAGSPFGSSGGDPRLPPPGRVFVSRDASQAEFDTLGETGGAKTHTLTIGQMPNHAHGVNDPGHAHQFDRPSLRVGASGTTETNYASHTGGLSSTQADVTGISIQNAGSGQAHPNLQPYVVVNYRIHI